MTEIVIIIDVDNYKDIEKIKKSAKKWYENEMLSTSIDMFRFAVLENFFGEIE